MRLHHPHKQVILPRIWLITDARNDAALENIIVRLPRRSGIIFRHYHLDDDARKRRFKTVQTVAKRHRHIIFLADSLARARAWKADGLHSRMHRRSLAKGISRSAPVHNMREITEAKQSGVDLFFLSPVATTRSHPGKKPLSRLQLRYLIKRCDKPVILLGGMDERRFRHYIKHAAYGWAAIDGLS